MFGHVLSGMEQNPALWIYRNLLLWLLFYMGGMLLTGRIAAQEIFQKKYYILIRYGNYEKWWQYLFIKIIREMFFYVLAVWIICNLGMLFIPEEFTLSNKIKILSFFFAGAFLDNAGCHTNGNNALDGKYESPICIYAAMYDSGIMGFRAVG